MSCINLEIFRKISLDLGSSFKNIGKLSNQKENYYSFVCGFVRSSLTPSVLQANSINIVRRKNIQSMILVFYIHFIKPSLCFVEDCPLELITELKCRYNRIIELCERFR